MPCLVGRPSGTTRSSCQPLACSSAPHSLALRSLLPHMTSICMGRGQREGLGGAGAKESKVVLLARRSLLRHLISIWGGGSRRHRLKQVSEQASARLHVSCNTQQPITAQAMARILRAAQRRPQQLAAHLQVSTQGRQAVGPVLWHHNLRMRDAHLCVLVQPLPRGSLHTCRALLYMLLLAGQKAWQAVNSSATARLHMDGNACCVSSAGSPSPRTAGPASLGKLPCAAPSGSAVGHTKLSVSNALKMGCWCSSQKRGSGGRAVRASCTAWVGVAGYRPDPIPQPKCAAP